MRRKPISPLSYEQRQSASRMRSACAPHVASSPGSSAAEPSRLFWLLLGGLGLGLCPVGTAEGSEPSASSASSAPGPGPGPPGPPGPKFRRGIYAFLDCHSDSTNGGREMERGREGEIEPRRVAV